MSKDLKVAYLLEKIMLDDETSKCITRSVDNIMRDGKIDQYDVPEIIFLIAGVVDNSDAINAKLTPENVASLIKELYKFIEKQYNLAPDESQRAGFERLVDSSIKLMLFQPQIKSGLKNCLSKIGACRK